MKLRNLLKPSDFIIPMPIGTILTLQYNASGNLEKVYSGYDNTRKDITQQVLQTILDNNTAPAHIHVKKGTTWVVGTLYTAELFSITGRIPEDTDALYLNKYIENPAQFNYFAVSIESTAITLSGYTSVRQCLVVAKFRIIPGWSIPNGFTDDMLTDWLHGDSYPFIPVSKTICIFRGSSIIYQNMPVTQFVVGSLKNELDPIGNVQTAITSEDTGIVIYKNYSEIIKHNIQKGSIILMDTDSEVLYCRTTSKVHYDLYITCPKCGKRYEIDPNENTICPNVHCVSRIVPKIQHFITALNLPAYSDSIIHDWVDTKNVTCIPDILLLDEYSDIEIETTISNVLRSLVPVSLIPRNDVFEAFALACGGNSKSILYYLENPSAISSDLGLTHYDLPKLIEWLSDDCNASDFNTVLNSQQIHITSVEKRFDGAPIFRGKTIYITGEFIHGSASEISAILQSYSATVTAQFSNVVDCVLVGGKQESINGKAVVQARTLNIPIFDELTFFNKYEIDADLNLV